MYILSIIIPTYNSSEYIVNTLDRICTNQISNYEIIIIDDFSQDDTIKKVKKFESKFNISIYKNEIKGVSNARNLGITKAQGKYVMFLDSDDLLSNQFSNIITDEILKNDYDFIIASYQSVSTDGEILSVSKNMNRSIESSINILRKWFNGEISICTGIMLMKHDIIKQKQLFYSTNISHGEDQEFHIKFLLNSEKGIILSEILLSYVVRDGSLSDNINDIDDSLSFLSSIEILVGNNSKLTKTFYNYYMPKNLLKVINNNIINNIDFDILKSYIIKYDIRNYMKQYKPIKFFGIFEKIIFLTSLKLYYKIVKFRNNM